MQAITSGGDSQALPSGAVIEYEAGIPVRIRSSGKRAAPARMLVEASGAAGVKLVMTGLNGRNWDDAKIVYVQPAEQFLETDRAQVLRSAFTIRRDPCSHLAQASETGDLCWRCVRDLLGCADKESKDRLRQGAEAGLLDVRSVPRVSGPGRPSLLYRIRS